MTDEELEMYNTSLKLFAGIALPGVMGRASSFATSEEIAQKAFDIAEAMMVESKIREKNECNSSTNS